MIHEEGRPCWPCMAITLRCTGTARPTGYASRTGLCTCIGAQGALREENSSNNSRLRRNAATSDRGADNVYDHEG